MAQISRVFVLLATSSEGNILLFRLNVNLKKFHEWSSIGLVVAALLWPRPECPSGGCEGAKDCFCVVSLGPVTRTWEIKHQ